MAKYSGTRSHDELKSYIKKMLIGDKDEEPLQLVEQEREKTEEYGYVLTLNSDNFESSIEKGLVFVKFFAPW